MPSRAELEASLWNDLLTPWFPACVSHEGGFDQAFAADWSPLEDPSRFLVFQARMTWVAAVVSETGHERADAFSGYARHGVRFLLDEMRDRETRAFRWIVRREGGHAEERHAYGQAFAIYGLAAAARALRSEEALEGAQGAFRWLELAHYDPRHGGWFEAATPSGETVLEGRSKGDAIGTPYGQKSQNTHLHLMEAYAELYRVWPDALLGERLEELLRAFQERFFVEEGWLHGFVEADWRPVPGTVSHGHDVEAAHLMLDAASALGRRDDPVTTDRARRLVDYALRTGWDAAGGGFVYAGSPAGEVLDFTKNWWVQAEGLLAVATLASRTGEARYAEALEAQWGWIREYQIDRAYGGWHESVDLAGEPQGLDQKGHAWKAAYHDGRGLLYSARLLA
ncbi:cellobiose 2-epimerase [soil metagenome]